MRTALIVTISIALLIIAYLFSIAYYRDQAASDWQNKYFAEQAFNIKNEQENKTLRDTNNSLVKKLLEIEKRTEETNKQIEAMRKELQETHKELEDSKTKPPTVIEKTVIVEKPPVVYCPPKPKLKPVKKKKRIPFDIAPSQQ